MPDFFRRGDQVRYVGSVRKYEQDVLVVLGFCRCGHCPCADPHCLPAGQPHYRLSDPWDEPSADPTTLPAVLEHARHSSLEPFTQRSSR